jgi:hypothetical protein
MNITSLTKKAVCVAMLSGAGIAANAAVTSLGSLPVGTTNFNNGAFVTPSDPTTDRAFFDLLFLGLPANGGSNYGVIEVPLDLSSIVPGLKFSTIFTFVSVMGLGPNGTFDGGDDVLLAGGAVAPTTGVSFDLAANSGGAVYLMVAGVTPIGSIGSLYSGSVTVSAVPEPESFAMLLAGLGLLGAIALRRNKSKSD